MHGQPEILKSNTICRCSRGVGSYSLSTAWRQACAGLVVATSLAWAVGLAHAQGNFGGGGLGAQAVGGISIDAEGIIQNLDPKALEALAATRRTALAEAAAVEPFGKIGKPTALRKVSLKRLIAAIEASAATGQPLPPEVLFLGGLDRITHLFVDPEGHDILLAGPADKAAIDPAGNIIAAASGRPLLQLEDLIVALRAIDGARAGGIRCSIDPTLEGITKLQQFLRNQKTIGPNPDTTLRSMEDALGSQLVTVGGVPADSRFARVMVAADYRMKRIGMGLEPSGIPELPSYLSMVPSGGSSAASLPRFWLEATYDPIARDPDELAYHIAGRRMKCLTESDLVGKDGMQRGKAPGDAIAVKWCAAMTAHYEKLALRQPVFSELLNCVDLAVVAALIHGRQLDHLAGLDVSMLRDAGRLPLPTYEAATTVPTVASGIKKGSRWIVSASGGVQFQPWGFASSTNESATVAATRTASLASRPVDGWWWD